ncbi:MAG TPA: DUF4160 domain-containing protein [Rhizomicrobium sp.]
MAIRIYFADENPPHVHVVGPDTEAKVAIGTAAIMVGEIPSSLRSEILEWIAENREALMRKWEECQ